MVRAAAHPLTGASTDYDGLLELSGEARFVLIGEASHVGRSWKNWKTTPTAQQPQTALCSLPSLAWPLNRATGGWRLLALVYNID
jgi:hypothetical protein